MLRELVCVFGVCRCAVCGLGVVVALPSMLRGVGWVGVIRLSLMFVVFIVPGCFAEVSIIIACVV